MTLDVAVIGAGGIAQTYRQALRGVSAVRVVAVADPVPDAAAAFAEDFGARVAVDHQELLRAGGFDAAVVCTPPASHASIVVDLLTAGVPVLCEKPLCVGLAAAETMAAATSAGVPLLMASKYRYVADVARAKQLIDDGAIGTPLLLENAFTGKVDMSRRWNARSEVSGGGVLIDNGTHSADIVRFLLGPITEVHAVEGPRIQPIDVEDDAVLFARTASGAAARCDLSWTFDKRLDDYVTVRGSDATIRLGWRRSVVVTPDGAETRLGDGYDKVAATHDEVVDFVGLIGGAEARIGLDDALASVAVIDAAYWSLADGSWQAVPASVSAQAGGPHSG